MYDVECVRSVYDYHRYFVHLGMCQSMKGWYNVIRFRQRY